MHCLMPALSYYLMNGECVYCHLFSTFFQAAFDFSIWILAWSDFVMRSSVPILYDNYSQNEEYN